jgi:hypothetical protein
MWRIEINRGEYELELGPYQEWHQEHALSGKLSTQGLRIVDFHVAFALLRADRSAMYAIRQELGRTEQYYRINRLSDDDAALIAARHVLDRRWQLTTTSSTQRPIGLRASPSAMESPARAQTPAGKERAQAIGESSAARVPQRSDRAYPAADAPSVPIPPVARKAADVPLHWIEIELLGEDGVPIQGEAYRVICPDGRIVEGCLDENGYARVGGIVGGRNCRVGFPRLDGDAWGWFDQVVHA